jgi:UDP-2,4-diacetamido-2,4,6-trideoxy-beta-L-altropyranose hydrolase
MTPGHIRPTGTVLFLTGGGRSIGFGHVRRCLSLAAELRKSSVQCEFLLDGDPAVVDTVSGSGFGSRPNRAGADEAVKRIRELTPAAVVADSYAFTTDYFRHLSETGRPVVAIDDLENRSLPVAMVVNARVGVGPDVYARHVTPQTRLLLGPAYALLRPEFADNPGRTTRPRVQRVLLTLGGSDGANLMPRLMRWVAEELDWVDVEVVSGPLFDNRQEIAATATSLGSRAILHEQPDAMRALMLEADIAVSGGGQTLYELAATATPTVGIRLAENQTGNLSELEVAGTLTWAGDVRGQDLEAGVRARVRRLAENPRERAAMATAGRGLVDGRGAERVAAALLQLTAQEQP